MGCGSSKKKIGSDLPQRKPPPSAQLSQSSASSGQPPQSSSRGLSSAAAAQPSQSSLQQTPGILPSSAQLSQSSASFGQPLQSSSRGPSSAAAAAAAAQPLQSSPQQTPGILASSQQKLQPFPKPQPKLCQRVPPPAGEPVRLLPYERFALGLLLRVYVMSVPKICDNHGLLPLLLRARNIRSRTGDNFLVWAEVVLLA
ncbi:hypothetical protein GJ744_006616 [Endocarpon pusillum]|uniref:Uncharacterized protein n=1 Tax=Endocarpon pusillum TaxID=364733 RepID=A0A8H7E9A7_9EURO|nr:hypothetical protein GJ744_006616 [Endocarpon pusillum]